MSTMARKYLSAAVAVSVVAAMGLLAGIAPKRAFAQDSSYFDDFETESSWETFEEIVGGNTCYGEGLAQVSRTNDAAVEGTHGLSVWANQALSTKSNHVIAHKRIDTTGRGGIWRYEVWSYIDPATGDDGQTGPEISVQNTRPGGGGINYTYTAGIQYRANRYSDRGTWAVWTEQSGGGAGWTIIAPHVELEVGRWYRLALLIDYDTNRYLGFSAMSPGYSYSGFDVENRVIVAEPKGFEPGVQLTVESENLWTTCTQAVDYRVLYDDVRFTEGETIADEARPEWVRQWGGAGYEDAHDIATIPGTGHVVVAGSTFPVWTSATTACPYDPTCGHDAEAFVREYDANGSLVWEDTFGSAGRDVASSVTVDALGNIYVAGVTDGDLDGSPDGSFDIFVRRYDAGTRNHAWSHKFAGSLSDMALDIAVDNVLGAVYYTGWSNTYGPERSEAYVTRLAAASGVSAWRVAIGSPLSDKGQGIAVDTAGNVYAVGIAGAPVYATDPAGAALVPDGTSFGKADAYVRKLDPSGNTVWTQQFGTTEADTAFGVATDATGVYVLGWTFGALPGQTQAGSAGTDIFVAKYDLAGSPLWTHQHGSPGDDARFEQVSVDNSGQQFPGLTTGQGGIAVDANGVYVAGSIHFALPCSDDATSSPNISLVQLDPATGAKTLHQGYGTVSGYEYPRGLAVLDDRLYVSGRTNGVVAGTGNAGDYDAFVARLRLNHLPTIDAGGPYEVDEGSAITLAATGSDPDGDALTYRWDLDNDGTFEAAGQTASFSAVGRDGPASQRVCAQVSDGCETWVAECTTVEIVDNSPPEITAVTGPTEPQPVGSTATVTADFTDDGTEDTHTCSVVWGDGSTSDGTVLELGGSGSCTASYVYADPGVYTVTVTVVDNDGGRHTDVYQYVVVYDPAGGFVTGGGWINSPLGAYVANPTLTGKANFGLVAKYLPGRSVPDGNTEFQFKAGDLKLKSTDYEWLVVSGGKKAQFKGTGTINGAGAYRFMVTVIDGEAPGGGGQDTFRIRIWSDGGGLVYDNQLGAPDEDDPTTVIGGGNIKIHKP